jgi:hypothetical protein
MDRTGNSWEVHFYYYTILLYPNPLYQVVTTQTVWGVPGVRAPIL